MFADSDVSEPGGQTAGISMKGPIETDLIGPPGQLAPNGCRILFLFPQEVTQQKSSV